MWGDITDLEPTGPHSERTQPVDMRARPWRALEKHLPRNRSRRWYEKGTQKSGPGWSESLWYSNCFVLFCFVFSLSLWSLENPLKFSPFVFAQGGVWDHTYFISLSLSHSNAWGVCLHLDNVVNHPFRCSICLSQMQHTRSSDFIFLLIRPTHSSLTLLNLQNGVTIKSVNVL